MPEKQNACRALGTRYCPRSPPRHKWLLTPKPCHVPAQRSRSRYGRMAATNQHTSCTTSMLRLTPAIHAKTPVARRRVAEPGVATVASRNAMLKERESRHHQRRHASNAHSSTCRVSCANMRKMNVQLAAHNAARQAGAAHGFVLL